MSGITTKSELTSMKSLLERMDSQDFVSGNRSKRFGQVAEDFISVSLEAESDVNNVLNSVQGNAEFSCVGMGDKIIVSPSIYSNGNQIPESEAVNEIMDTPIARSKNIQDSFKAFVGKLVDSYSFDSKSENNGVYIRKPSPF